MDLDWHLMPISEEEAPLSQPPPPNPIADARPRKKKARTLRETDWEPYKDRIIQLHLTEKRPLSEVRILIEQEFGFNAEIRQYRSRLSQWKLDKNIKPDEMKAIVRHHQQRNLVETDKNDLKFSVRGQGVDPHKIERWMKRHNVMDSMLYAPSPDATTPSAVSYATMSEIGSPGTQSMLSPGVMHDVDLTVEHVPTTPRQIISSLPTTPRQQTDYALKFPGWDTTNPLAALHLVKVDDEHLFARWRCNFNVYINSLFDFRKYLESTWSHYSNTEWPQHVRLNQTFPLAHLRAAMFLCRQSTQEYLWITSGVGNVPYNMQRDIDLIVYIRHDPHTNIFGVRFTSQDWQTRKSLQRPMGFELVSGSGVQMCKVAQGISWMPLTINFVRLLGWRVVIADESELQPFTWPSNDDDVERAQFFISHFAWRCRGRLILTISRSLLQ